MNKIFKNVITYICLITILPLFFKNIIKSSEVFNSWGTILIYLMTGLVIYFLNYSEINNMFKKYKNNCSDLDYWFSDYDD